MLESRLEAIFRTRVATVGGMVCKLAPTERGVPDRLVLMPGGKIYLVELKQKGGKTSPIQQSWHERAARRGVEVSVVEGTAGINHWLLTHVGR